MVDGADKSVSSAVNSAVKKPHLQGLKVGLEGHQQLGNSSIKNKKLFCNCTAEIIERHPDYTFTRSLRAIAGETGAIDRAAAAEQAKGKQFVYQGFHEHSCLVDMDEEPPHAINQEVITTGIMVAKAFGSTIFPNMQVMRKTVVDGSAVSGFQRTGLFAIGGIVPDIEPKVRIQTVCIEEEASKIVARGSSEDIYNLSRLGIPLLEIATEPDIISPEHAQETAAAIGMVLRSTKRVKRGLGTIRQDVNVSIPGGTRVEIKGCQDLRLIPTIIDYEAMRQYNLLQIKHDLTDNAKKTETKKRVFATLSSADLIDVTNIFAASSVGFIKQALAKGNRAMLLQVPGLAGFFGKELCPNYRLGTEFADLARTRGFGGLIHSDEALSKYGLATNELNEKYANSKESTGIAYMILIGEPARISAAMDDLLIPRLVMLCDGVPAEVRKDNPDGTTSYQRPMPGAARMYPETDIQIVKIDTANVQAPKLLSEQVLDITRLSGISEDQARQIVREGLPFEEWLIRYPSIEPIFLATAMLTFGKEIHARYKKEIDNVSLLEPLLADVEKKKLPKTAVFEILVEIAEGKIKPGQIDYAKYEGISESELSKIVDEEFAKNPNLAANGIMGNVMNRMRGRVDGKQVMAVILKKKVVN